MQKTLFEGISNKPHELLVMLTDMMADPEFFTIDLVRAFEMEDE